MSPRDDLGDRGGLFGAGRDAARRGARDARDDAKQEVFACDRCGAMSFQRHPQLGVRMDARPCRRCGGTLTSRGVIRDGDPIPGVNIDHEFNPEGGK